MHISILIGAGAAARQHLLGVLTHHALFRLSLQFIFFNAVSIVLDVLRLAMAPDGMHGFFLLVLLQIAGMLCKVHVCGVIDDCPECFSGPGHPHELLLVSNTLQILCAGICDISML